MKFVLVVVLCFISRLEVQALSCYKCTYIDDRYDSCSNNLVKSDRDYSCDDNMPRNSIIEVCPEEGYKCGIIEGHIRVHARLDITSSNWCNFSAAVTIRKCIKADFPEDVCVLDDATVVKEVKSVMDTKGAEVHLTAEGGDVCYCSTSFCDPRCREDTYRISGLCIPKWVFYTAGGVLLFFILAGIVGCTCCCRKCCCCCRKTPSTGSEESVRSADRPNSGYAYQRLHSNGPV